MNQPFLENKSLQHLFLQAPAAIAVVSGSELRYVLANGLYQQLFNRSEQELIGRTVRDAFPELEGEGTLEVFDQVFSTGVAYRATEYLFTWDKERTGVLVQGYFNFIAQPVNDERGNVFAILIHVYEVTEQVLARRTAEDKEKQFRQIADSLPQIVWTCTPDGSTDYYNKRWYEYTGFDECYGDQSWLPLLHPEDVDRTLKVFRHAIETGERYMIHYRFADRTNPGSYRWFMGLADPVRDIDGNIVRWFGTCTDVHDQKELSNILEQKVTERTAELKELTRAFEQAEEISNMGNFRWNMDNNKVFWSKNLYHIYGVSHETFVPDIDSINNFTHPEDRAMVAEHSAKAIQEKVPHPITFRIIDANGIEKYISGSGIIYEDNGRHIMIGTLQDITSQKLQELSIKRKNQELELANSELESFTYISTHDLQEPLRKIQTMVSHLQETEAGRLTEKGMYLFGRIANAAGRMRALINDLMTFSKNVTQERKFTEIKILSAVEEVRNSLSEELALANAVVSIEGTGSFPGIPYQFAQILENLLLNSLKFAKQGVSPKINIVFKPIVPHPPEGLRQDSTYCMVSYEDNGIGFEAIYNKKIFKIFQRLHSKDDYEGTGIGLAIVKKIVDNHGGTITAEGHPGHGARFVMYFPQYKLD